MARPALKRQAVVYIVDHYAVARRRACRIIRQHRSVQYYRTCKDPRTALRARMRELAQVRMRYGYGGYMCFCGAKAGIWAGNWRIGCIQKKACNCAANDRAVARWSSLAASDTFPNGATRRGPWISSPISSPMAAS